ncbi:MAG: formimidoylglutamate deiminase [Ancalomicrobiaceae bacterium]|nr:formimidoylglutamate deiminase [Ancalomicrobiaceae bacterium]
MAAMRLILDEALTPDGWQRDVLVAWADGVFTEVTPLADAAGLPGVERVAGVAVPGVGNLHSHAFQRGFAGLTESRGGGAEDHFWTWREAMYRFANTIEPDDLRAIAALAQIEMLESGFTGVAEFHYVHHARDGRPYDDPAEMAAAVVAAAETTGIGLTLLPVFYAHGGFGGHPTHAGQRRFVTDLDDFAELHTSAAKAVVSLPGGRIGVAPHSLRAVSADELQALVSLRQAGPIHIHIAEQIAEVEDCLAATGQRPVDYLMDLVDVDANWCLVHATHVTQAEIARMAACRATVGLCPITEADLGDGIFPGVDLVAAGGNFGVGSDSNVLISLPQELRLLEQSQRLNDRARNRLTRPPKSTGRTLFDFAANGGAAALANGCGRIAVGATADLVVLDRTHPALIARDGDARLDAWIFACPDNPVRDIWTRGRHVVIAGRHVARDTVAAEWQRTQLRLSNR